jgi:aminopeptidase
MNKTILKNYAKIIARVGVNVQKGQDVNIAAGVSDEYFVKYVIEECYKAGARKVVVDWISDIETKLGYKYQKVESLSEFPVWKEEKLKYQVEKLPARIFIDSADPDAMAGVDQEKMTAVRRILGPKTMPYREAMENKYQWTIVGIPSEAWAKKIFPNETKSNAMKKLWDAILKTKRIYGNPIENWKEHNKNLRDKYRKLNDLKIKTLYYTASNGTNFNVSIKDCMVWNGGDETTLSGVIFQPNMPTEECFTSPDKTTANGVVYASKSLSVMGKVVDNFGFRFENGKIVEVLAQNSEHKELLEKLISLDEGARQLGEVALVPFDSPINQTGLLFYNTLYDENACCHLAIGRAFNDCIRDFDKKSEEEIKAVDLNISMIHVDFMIGTRDLHIKADTYDGNHVVIFDNGTWAI